MIAMDVLTSERINLLYALCLLLALWLGWIKTIRPRLRAARQRWTQATDALLGRDAINDSITGEERVPALPGIGQRMSTVEDVMQTLVEAVSDQRKIQEKVIDHEARISRLERDDLRAVLQAAERAATAASAAEVLRMVNERDTLDGAADEPPEGDTS